MINFPQILIIPVNYSMTAIPAVFAAGDCFITAVLCKPSRIYIMPIALPAVNPNGIPHFNFSGL